MIKCVFRSFAAAAILIAGPAAAADLTVTVKGDDGAPLADAVVLAHPAGGSAQAGPIRIGEALDRLMQD